MKTLLYISIFGILGCNNQTHNSDKSHPIEKVIKIDAAKKIHTDITSETITKTEKSKYYTNNDTLAIKTETGYTIKYGKEEFNGIIDNHPELTSTHTDNPDQAYHCSEDNEGFISEAGQDRYFILYAYFLKNKNGDKKYSEIRKKLMDIFQNINLLFGNFEYGGTYFGHQGARILGYAEYSVYLYKQNETRPISKTYDIAKQKNIYINSLRQLISDEISIDVNTTGQDKIERVKRLNKIVDDIDKAITDNFYLRRTQDFHYGHYEYY